MDIAIRKLVPDDAHDLVALFRRCYGDTYGTESFYKPDLLREQIEAGLLRSVVATNGETLVGHTGMTIRHAGALVCETGNTVVDPAARGQRLLRKLGAALNEYVQEDGFIGYVHYPTTAHDIMQKASIAQGGVETGVMLAYVSADTDYQAIETKSGRLAATVVYQPFKSAPERDVVLPQRYRTILLTLYQNLRLDRTHVSVKTVRSPVSRIAVDVNVRRGLLHLSVAEPGDDLGDIVKALRADHSPPVIHIDLPLTLVSIDQTIAQLTAQGFFFCGLLPEFMDTDVLRLQAIEWSEDSDDRPQLVNETAQDLYAFMRHDSHPRQNPATE